MTNLKRWLRTGTLVLAIPFLGLFDRCERDLCERDRELAHQLGFDCEFNIP